MYCVCYFTHFLYFFSWPHLGSQELWGARISYRMYIRVLRMPVQGLYHPRRGQVFPHLPSLPLREREERRSAVSSPATNAFVGHFELRKRVWWQQNCSFCSSVGPKIYITGQEMSPELVVLGGKNFSFAPCLIPLLEYRRPYTSEPCKNS